MFALSLLFALSATLAIATISLGLRPYRQRVATVRQDLAATPQTRELRFRVIELRPSNVVQLPVRRRVAGPLEGLRAAA